MLYVAYPWFWCSRVHLSAKPAAVNAQTFSTQFFSTSVASHLPLEMHPETSAPLCSADKPCRASSSGFWFPLERDLQLTLNLLNPGCPPPKTSFFLQEAPLFEGNLLSKVPGLRGEPRKPSGPCGCAFSLLPPLCPWRCEVAGPGEQNTHTPRHGQRQRNLLAPGLNRKCEV